MKPETIVITFKEKSAAGLVIAAIAFGLFLAAQDNRLHTGALTEATAEANRGDIAGALEFLGLHETAAPLRKRDNDCRHVFGGELRRLVTEHPCRDLRRMTVTAVDREGRRVLIDLARVAMPDRASACALGTAFELREGEVGGLRELGRTYSRRAAHGDGGTVTLAIAAAPDGASLDGVADVARLFPVE
jgi:hypothetical protein